MPLDPRTPVIVGVAQATWRDGAPDPGTMLADVARAAGRDAGADAGAALLRRLDSLAVVDHVSGRRPDPAAPVAAKLGLAPGERVRTTLGGDSPQALVNDLAGRIAAGRADVALVCGCEALATLARAMRAGVPTGWPGPDPDEAPDRVLGTDRPDTNEAETAAGLLAPVMVYPLFENALWAAGGRTLADHRAELGRLWARFSAVAAQNPHAWDRTPHDAAEIATPSAANRMVTLPYTKLMNANIQTDQAAALLLCSAEAAAAAGVPRDRWVFVHAGAAAADHWHVSTRADLRSSPALRLAGRAALDAAGLGIDDIGHLDLYSCFPSAVQIAAAELGVDLDDPGRPATVTGGLSFAGGPGNDYVTHAIATMAERLRREDGATGLVTAVGWYLTKHAVGVYSARPPERPFRVAGVQEAVDALPRREVVEPGHAGPAIGESVSVVYERDGAPSIGMLAALLEDGRRALAQTRDPATLAAMTSAPLTGIPVRLDGEGGFALEA